MPFSYNWEWLNIKLFNDFVFELTGVEHTEVENAMENYWYMWKLPMFGETDVDTILAECKACHDANPENHVRLIGYDNYAQSQGASMVIYRGKGFK